MASATEKQGGADGQAEETLLMTKPRRLGIAALGGMALTLFLSGCAAAPSGTQGPPPWLGVAVREIQAKTFADDNAAEVLTMHLLHPVSGWRRADVADDTAVQIAAVVPGTPAAIGGLREGDILLTLDGKAILSAEDFLTAIGSAGSKPTPITAIRGGQKVVVTVTPEPQPADAGTRFRKAMDGRIRSEEEQASAATAAGNDKAAFYHYVRALRTMLLDRASIYPEFNLSQEPSFSRDLSRLQGAAHRLRPPPTITREAALYNQRATAILQRTLNTLREDDNDSAANEFWSAIFAAPWVPDLYRNYGLTLAKAGHAEGALVALKRYLLLAPESPDATEVRRKVTELQPMADAQRPWLPFLCTFRPQGGPITMLTLHQRTLIWSLLSGSFKTWEGRPYKPGDAMFRGTISGRRFRGTLSLHPEGPSELVAQYGRTIVIDLDGEIDSSGRQFAVRWFRPDRNQWAPFISIAACRTGTM